MKICEVLKVEEAYWTIDSMFRMLCLGVISRDMFIGAVIFAKNCGLLTGSECGFLIDASWEIKGYHQTRKAE